MKALLTYLPNVKTKTRNTAHLIAVLDAIKARTASVGLSSQADVVAISDLARTAFNALAEGISRVKALEDNDTLRPEFQQASIETVYNEVRVKVEAVAAEVQGRAESLVQNLTIQAAPKMPISDSTAAEVALLNARTLAGSVMDRAASGQKAAALLELFERAKSQGDVGLKYLLGATDWAELLLNGSGPYEAEDLAQWQQGAAQRFAQVAPAEAQKAREQLTVGREWLNVPMLLRAGLHELTSPDDVNFFEAIMIDDVLRG